MAQERNASAGDKSESRRLSGRAMSYLAQASECRAIESGTPWIRFAWRSWEKRCGRKQAAWARIQESDSPPWSVEMSAFLPKADAAERRGPLVSRRLKNCRDRVCLPVAPRSTSKAYVAQPALKMWAKVKSTPMAVITATNATNTQVSTCHLRSGPVIYSFSPSMLAAIQNAVSTVSSEIAPSSGSATL
jgi:hypothetical protein